MATERRRFEEVEIGEARESHGRTVTVHEVYTFAGLEGHYGELHCNKEYAESTPYRGRIAHGALLVTLIQGFMASLDWQFDVYALYGFDRVRFVNPVFIDDTVHLEAEVVDKEPRDDETGVVTVGCELTKSDGSVAAALEWLILLNRE